MVSLFNFIDKEHCGKAKFTVFVNTPGTVQKTWKYYTEVCVRSFASYCLTSSPKMDQEQYN